ncbi:hypothetical protein OHB26_27865 [Nocardia sp. NBC_01503]|uniref:hypothetical protein n=1 Tax=Nocardia sp. NBC_01503 TaxID=2975997 RepID=UPI002E7BD241|nr:hypothetical protein [Nocardia sp. NBC_01503]WTL30727.1 hypothetical protein OHB26_27865 [Nocardia sp. NBC_01503]
MTVTNTQHLLSEVLSRYGSVDAFCSRLRDSIYQTTELPRIAPEPETGGRHRRYDPA